MTNERVARTRIRRSPRALQPITVGERRAHGRTELGDWASMSDGRDLSLRSVSTAESRNHQTSPAPAGTVPQRCLVPSAGRVDIVTTAAHKRPGQPVARRRPFMPVCGRVYSKDHRVGDRRLMAQWVTRPTRYPWQGATGTTRCRATGSQSPQATIPAPRSARGTRRSPRSARSR